MNKRHLVAVLLVGSLSSFAWPSQSSASNTLPAPPLKAEPRSSHDTIIDFVHATLAQNPKMEAARLVLRAGESLASAAAKPLYNPELEFSSENAEVQTRTVGLSQTLDWSGKRKARRNVAEAERNAALFEYKVMRQSMGIELLSTLASHQTNTDRYALSLKRARVMQQFLDLAKKRFETGDMPLVEFNFAKMATAQARMENATSAANAIDVRQQLSMLANREPKSAWPKLDTQLPTLADLEDQQTMILALPAISAAQSMVEAANAAAILKERERRTDPTIGVTGGEEGDDSLFGITLSIPIPIRNGYRNEANAAKDQYLGQIQLFKNFEQQAKARLLSAHERYKIAKAAWLEWQQMGQSSIAQQTEQLRQLWASGELSTTDYLVQTEQTIGSQDSALSLRHTLWQAWFEWLGASGQVEQWLELERSDQNDVPSN